MTNSLQEYKELVVNYLRDMESMQAQGDYGRLRQLDETSDEDLLRKWFWLGSLGGGVACGVLTFLFRFLDEWIPFIVMQILWIALQGLWGVVAILFVLAIIVTVRR